MGRYVVERPIGAGGMGVVSLARDPELRRPVVIKLVHPNMSHGEGGDELEARLRREAQAMAQVSHPNVVQIFDIGRRGERVFLAMEFVAGQTLDAWLRERRRTPDEILGVIGQAGAGVAAAHRAGLVHRDLKPSNVLVGRDGVVKVTDFGLARAVVSGIDGAVAGAGPGATRQLRVPSREPRPSGVHAVLTEVNAVVGTPAYMAPEQASGAAFDARTDQYALAVTLLDALLGQSPTRRAVAPGAPAEVIDAALADAGMAAQVRAAIVRALAEEPSARFPAIDDFLRALAPGPAPAPTAARPRARSRRIALVVIGVALCAIATGAWLVVRGVGTDCSSQAPQRWAAARAGAVAAIAGADRPFSGWEAERVAAAFDGAVGGLAAAETARCRGAGTAAEPSAGCVARRSAALTAAIAALSAAPPPEDPWLLLAPVERCELTVPVERAGALRGELRTAAAPRAREIADAARAAGHDRLAADALEAAGVAALAAGDAAAADADFQSMATAGERSGDDAVRGRALLQLIAAARWRGNHADGKRAADLLHAMLARHHDDPRDQLVVALAEAAAFADLGDVATAFAAWDRARQAATALGNADAALAASIGRAWSSHALRFDLPGARSEATAALAAATAGSPAARSAALGIAAELALEAHDGRAAQAALDEVSRLVPARSVVDRLRAQRARALLGDVDGALADLVPAASDDANTAARILIARGKVLLAADHASEAVDVLDKVSSELRSFNRARAALPVAERIDLELASCEAQLVARDTCKTSYRIDLLVPGLHARAPARARVALVEARGASSADSRTMRGFELSKALGILVEAGAAAMPIAELRWQIAQICPFNTDCRGLAGQAREVFQAAGRTAEVADIDRWLVDQPPTPAWITRDAGAAPDATPPARRDPWGPQP
ncbi:MAG: serine/threonine protein kinase [Deltaproteobacteria bacterium]|nr:MAG: serine/threonine protein kinase [Deltaproteobacteria bacterium]